MSTRTGLRPAKRAGGVLSSPEISRPSKLFQRTIDCSPNAGRVDARRRVRGRPALHGAVGGVDDGDRARRRAALVGDGEPRQARMEVGVGGAAVRQPRRGQLVEGVGVEEANLVAALDVGAHGEQAAARVEADVDDVPGNAPADGGRLRIAEAIEHQLAEFAAAIADEEEARAVALPHRSEVGGGRASRRRQHLALGAGREIEQPDFRLQRRHVARQRDGRVVPRHHVGRPAAAGQFGEASPCLRPHRVHQPERLRDLVATAAARGSVERHRRGRATGSNDAASLACRCARRAR